MERIFSICILLAIGIDGSEIQVNVFEKRIKGFRLQMFIPRSTSKFNSHTERDRVHFGMFENNGLRVSLYTSDACVICSARYTENDVTRLVSMPGSAYFSKAVRCDTGWLAFRHSCYYFNASVMLDVPQLKEYCSKMGAHLVVIDDVQEHDFVVNVVSASSASHVWIGIERNGPTDAWLSSFDHKSVTFFNWHPTEPQSELCVLMNKPDPYNWQWIDYYCTHNGHTVCEKEGL